MLEIIITPPPSLQDKIEALREASWVAPALIRTQVKTSAFNIVNGAKKLVPKATGALFRSIQPYFFDDGFSAVIGSYLPYAAKQEYDMTLNHGVRPAKRYSRGLRKGLVVHGTNQSNPDATWGFMRKALANERPAFLLGLIKIVQQFSDAWEGA